MSAYAVSSRGLAAHKVPQGVLATIMEMLYSNSEQGIAKLDFSDFTGMYQDRARTIPYTAVEQPLGSFTGLNGVTATAPADVNRGVVSARVNLLTKTEDINNAAWSKPGVSVISSGVLAPDGTMSAFTIKAGSGAGSKILWYFQSGPTSATPYTSVVWIRNRSVIPGGSYIRLVNTSLGVIAGSSRQFPAVASGWVQMSISGTHAGASGGGLRLDIGTDGNEEGEWDIWHPSLTLATDAHLPYQRVNTPTDYDTAGFPHYLAFNGTNTTYVTPSIDFSGTDKMTVWAGVTKLSDTPSQIIAELSSVAESQPGSWFLASQYVSYNYFANSLGLYANGRAIVAFAVPTVSKDFITLQMDLSAPTPAGRLSARRNTSGSANTGVFGYGGNYGNYPLYIGARNNTSLFFSGRIYSLIVRGAESSISQIEATENLIRKTMRLP